MQFYMFDLVILVFLNKATSIAILGRKILHYQKLYSTCNFLSLRNKRQGCLMKVNFTHNKGSICNIDIKVASSVYILIMLSNTYSRSIVCHILNSLTVSSLKVHFVFVCVKCINTAEPISMTPTLGSISKVTIKNRQQGSQKMTL